MTVAELADKIAGSIDRQKMAELRIQHAGCWADKFYDVETYATRAANKAFEIGLEETCLSKRILDVGAGFGYLCLAANILEHDATALEVPSEVIDAVYQAMPSPLVKHVVKAHEPLPPLGEPFDLITMMGVNFVTGPLNKPDEWNWWREPEYKFLIADLYARLNRGGEIRVEFNWGSETNFLRDVAWEQPFETIGNVIRIRKA